METLKEPIRPETAKEGFDVVMWRCFQRAQAIGAIDPGLTFEEWNPPEAEEETHEEFLQSLRESVASGTRNCIPADIFLEEWRRDIDERERAAEGGR